MELSSPKNKTFQERTSQASKIMKKKKKCSGKVSIFQEMEFSSLKLNFFLYFKRELSEPEK